MSQLKEAEHRSDHATSRAPEERGMMAALRAYPAFRMLLIGTLATNSAFWMYQVAVGWLALQLTDSPLFVGLAGFASGIPMLLFSLPAGVVIDRYDRRVVLLIAQAGVMLVSGVFAAMVGTDIIEPWSILVLVAVYGTIMTFIFPVRTAMVPSLVDRQDIAIAIALNSAVQNVTRVVGPSVAGVLIALIGVSETFAVAAAMQALALVATSRLPSNASAPSTNAGTRWEALTLGFRIVARSPYLIALIVLSLAPTVLVMPYINLMPIFARDELGLGSTGLGVLLASTGLGTVAGALSVAHSPSFRGRRGAQVVTATGFAVGVLVFAVTPNIPLAAVLLFGAGWMSAAFLAINQTALQLYVDDEVRGRVLSVYLLTWGMLPIGQLAVGALADIVGTPLAMLSSCIAAIACIAVIAWRFPSLRT
ncbi:MAG: MFS transporter [Chloroflexota bacterium]|nr:MFS transporter [Chloroflexota bacterium]